MTLTLSRDEWVELPEDEHVLSRIKNEAEFFQVFSLVDLINAKINDRDIRLSESQEVKSVSLETLPTDETQKRVCNLS